MCFMALRGVRQSDPSQGFSVVMLSSVKLTVSIKKYNIATNRKMAEVVEINGFPFLETTLSKLTYTG